MGQTQGNPLEKAAGLSCIAAIKNKVAPAAAAASPAGEAGEAGEVKDGESPVLENKEAAAEGE